MSVQALGWVLDHSTATGTDRLVLVSLANYAGKTPGNGAWESWPGIETITREARLGRERTTTDALTRMVKAGLIERIINGAPDERIPKDRRPNLYRILLAAGVACDDDDCRWCCGQRQTGVSPGRTPRGVAGSSTGVSPGRSTGSDPTTPEPLLEPSGEPKCATPTSHADESHQIATWFYDNVKAKTNGIAPKFMGVRTVVAGALSQGCTGAEIRAALRALWRDRQITAPTTAMIVEVVVRDRVTDRPEMPTRSAIDDVRRCHRDDCRMPIVVGGECTQGHEQPAPDLVVTIEEAKV